MPKRRWPKKCATASGTGKRVMLRMPTSTADTVACACVPASCGALSVTRSGRSGRTSSATFSPTATRRSRRSIGTWATPTARAGVVTSTALPPRNTSAVT